MTLPPEVVAYVRTNTGGPARREADLAVWLNANPDSIDDLDSEGRPLLIHAVYTNDPQIVRLILSRGANTEVTSTSYSCTALQIVTMMADSSLGISENLENIELLLGYGADINAGHASMSLTPLMWASVRAELQISRLLVRRGANIDLANSLGAATMDAEAYARSGVTTYERMGSAQHEVAPRYRGIADYLAAVRAAGGYASYARRPREDLLVLRALCERGRAAPPGGLEPLFPHDGTRLRLPRELAWKIFSLWRSERD